MPIDLLKLLEIEQPRLYKFHAARFDNQNRPLDVFVRSHDDWIGWNTWRKYRDDFNRRYILSFMDFYPQRQTWLFGGIFEVYSRGSVEDHSYVIRPSEQGADLVGRLKIRAVISRGRAFLLENLAPSITVTEVLAERYSGETFPGYDNVSLDFAQLEVLVSQQRIDWKTALEHMKGVYVIVDRKTGKKYVGSAYNDVGIWSRWCSYVATGHGWNKALVELMAQGGGIAYARENFRISLLEAWPFRTEDRVIIGREGHWKEVLLTRGDHGYNMN